MRKTLTAVMLAASLLGLAGCRASQHSAKTTAPRKVQTGSHKKSTVRLNAAKLSPKKTAAAITVYAASKYGGPWQNSLNSARRDRLNIVLRKQSDFPYMNQGLGVAYKISQAGYTMTQSGSGPDGKIIYFYDQQKKLGQASVSQIAQKVNSLDRADQVNKLAASARIIDQRGASQNQGTAKTSLPGDEGLFSVPAQLQGTWYSYSEGKMQRLVITDHSVINGQEEQQLHKQQHDFDFERFEKDKTYMEKTANWGRAVMASAHGIDFMNVQGWTQGAGDGESYGIKNLAGQTALVTASGADFWTDEVFWPTEALARQFAHKKFPDLDYR